MGMTPYFYRKGSPYAAFWYTNEYEQRGAAYTHMVSNRVDKWGLKPHPRIPNVLKKVVDEAILVRQPPLPLFLSEETQHPQKNKHLDYVKKTVSRVSNGFDGIINVPIYVRPNNISTTIAKANAGDLQRLKQVTGIDYDLEEATDEIYAYRVLVHVGIKK
jgi:hypothetical protein